MRKSDGFFDGHLPKPEFPHAIPSDGFDHIENFSCACNPYLETIVGVGSVIAHRPIEIQVPDTIPKEWE